MEEAIEAHGVPPEHISIPLLDNHRSDSSTIVSERPGSIVIGGGPFVNDDFHENIAPRKTFVPSPSMVKRKGKRITPEDLPLAPLANYEQSSFKSKATDGCFQESFNESFNIMFQDEGSTKAFGTMIANGNREIYNSEAASSFEERVRNDMPINPPSRGRSSSRPRDRSNAIHRTRSKSRTRIYETVKSKSARSNMILKEPTSRCQLNVAISKSSSVDSMNDYEEGNAFTPYVEKEMNMSEQIVINEDKVKVKEGQLQKQKSSGVSRSPTKRRDSFKRDLVEDSSSEEEDEVRQEASTPIPRSRNHRDIADFVQDDVNEESDENLSVDEEEESIYISIQSPPKKEDIKRTPISTPVSTKKKFGKSWSPSGSSFGESVEKLEQQQTPSPPKRRASKLNLASPLQKKQEVGRSVSSAPTTFEPSTEGCYLVFDPSSGGKLTLQFSKIIVKGAIGFWAPGEGKKLQGFKFKQNQGRSDLMTGIAGKDYKKKYFNGWCQFVKAAKMYNGSVCKWSEHERIELDIYVFYNNSCKVQKLEDGELFNVSDIDAVSCLPRGNSTFDGVKTGEYGTFINRGDAAGCSMAFR